MISAVTDTNVLVSALLKTTGNQALLVTAVGLGSIHPYFSTAIMEEYRLVLSRPWLNFAPNDVADLIELIIINGTLVEAPPQPVTSPDASDSKFIRCAIAAQADVIVTGNRRHFPDAPYGRTLVISTTDLLDYLTFGD